MGTCVPVTDRLAAEQAVNKVLDTMHTFVGGRWV
jgi:hypothetical protein